MTWKHQVAKQKALYSFLLAELLFCLSIHNYCCHMCREELKSEILISLSPWSNSLSLANDWLCQRCMMWFCPIKTVDKGGNFFHVKELHEKEKKINSCIEKNSLFLFNFAVYLWCLQWHVGALKGISLRTEINVSKSIYEIMDRIFDVIAELFLGCETTILLLLLFSPKSCLTLWPSGF